MPILGAHMSIAGGYYKAAEAAQRVGCDCVQVFTKNNNQWRAKEITSKDIELFQNALANLSISHPISHASYLINLASPDDALWQKSLDAMIVELERADQLGIPYVVVHPGSYTSSTPEEGIARIAKGLNEIHRQRTKLKAITLLENTAGQGTNLGWDFGQLGAIRSQVKTPERVGYCFDTCHAHAAGYDMRTPQGFKETFAKFDKEAGLNSLFAFHLNDSKKELGSRVDRHEHIGQGDLGLEPFRMLLNDRRFVKTPMYLETPKGEQDDRDLDEINLETLRGLLEPSTSNRKKVAAKSAPAARSTPKKKLKKAKKRASK